MNILKLSCILFKFPFKLSFELSFKLSSSPNHLNRYYISGVLAPTSMTFMSFIGPLLLAGLLHMEESYCMLYMPVYLVTIPSMYILLVIYSLFNLWNTGENNQLSFKLAVNSD